MYREIVYKAGATRETIRCYPTGMRKGVERGECIRKKSKEEIREANRRQARRDLERLMNANFKPGDWHVVLTYRKEIRPSPEEARKELENFLARLRRRYRKFGFDLKYIVATEYVSKHIHHHLVVNNVNTGTETTADMVRLLWTKKRMVRSVGIRSSFSCTTPENIASWRIILLRRQKRASGERTAQSDRGIRVPEI